VSLASTCAILILDFRQILFYSVSIATIIYKTKIIDTHTQILNLPRLHLEANGCALRAGASGLAGESDSGNNKKRNRPPEKPHNPLSRIGLFQGIPGPNASHSASRKQKRPRDESLSRCFNWSGREDLNLRPPAPKAGGTVFSFHFISCQKSTIYLIYPYNIGIFEIHFVSFLFTVFGVICYPRCYPELM